MRFVLPTALALAVLFASIALPSGGPRAHAQDGDQGAFSFAIDADVANGVCDPIDPVAEVDPASPFQVGLCIVDPPVAPHAFRLVVVYDDKLVRMPETDVVLPALDGNPDANAGRTTFSSPDLGEGWDCTGLSVFPPAADVPTTEEIDAQIACNPDLVSPDARLVDGGPLAVITFEPKRAGVLDLVFSPSTEVGGPVSTIATCGLVPDQTIPCAGARVYIGVEAPETAASSQPSAEPQDAGDGGLSVAALAGIVAGAVAALGLTAGGLYLWAARRRLV